MPTKTAPDPVAEAQAALTTATQAEHDARQHNDELRQRILDGDQGVTAEDLAAAAHSVEHAVLGVEAAQLAAQAAEQTARRQRLAELTAEVTALAGDPDAAIEAVSVIEEAVHGLLVADNARHQNLTRWIMTARREGVPQLEPNAKDRPDNKGRMPYRELSDEHGHVGWQEPGMGRTETFYAGGRKITRSNPGELIRAAIERACQRAGGRTADYLELNHRPDPRVTNDPEGWIRERY